MQFARGGGEFDAVWDAQHLREGVVKILQAGE